MVLSRGRVGQVWLAYLLGGLALTALYFALPTAALQNLLYDGVGLASVVAILGGVWLHRPVARAPWLLLALGNALAVGGDLIWTYNENVRGVPSPFPSSGDFLYLGGYLIFFAGVLLLIRTQRASRTRATVIDTAMITLGIGIVVWTALIAPVMADSARPLRDRLVASAYPAVDLLVLVAAVCLALTLARRTLSLQLLLLALGVTFATDIAYALAVAQGIYATGSPIDAGWLLGYCLHGVLALHPSMRERPEQEATTDDLAPGRLALLAAVSLVGPGLLAYQSLRGRPLDVLLIACASATLFLLALARLQLLAEELRRREARFRALVQHSSDIVMVLDAAGVVRESSPALRRVLGHPLREQVGRPFADLVYPDDLPLATAALARLRAQPGSAAPFEVRLRDGAGGWRHIEVVGTQLLADPHIGGIVLNCRDITVRRRTESALRESEAGLATAQQIAHLGDWGWDAGRGVMRWSDELFRLLGHEPGAVTPHFNHFLRVVHPADRGLVRRWARTVYAGQEADLEHRLLLPDGAIRIVQHRAEVVCHPERAGGVRRLAGTLLDVTEHARVDATQRLLARSGELLAAPLDLDATLDTIAALVVPALGDWCIVDLQRDGARAERSLIAHADPALAATARDLSGARQVCADAVNAGPLARSLRDGPPGTGADELAGALADRPERRAAYAALGVGAYMVAPIEARSRPIGALTVVSADPARRYDAHDLHLLADLARRAGLALDNTALRLALAAREGELQDLVGRLLLEQEEERRRVAYDVHDGLAQLTASVYQRLQAYEYQHQPSPGAAERDFAETVSVAQQAVAEARRVIANLRPIALDDFGVGVAVRRQVEYLRAQGWEIDYRDSLAGARFAPAVEVALYRVAQEALNNIRKHARAERVWIDLERDRCSLTLRVRDDGIGLRAAVPETAGAGERIGLRGMRERVTLLGGQFSVAGAPGQGTTVLAAIPLPCEDSDG